MAWDTTLLTRLRLVIGDIDSSNQTWTDTQLNQFIAIGAISVIIEVDDLGVTFTVDTDIPSISPDPVTEVADVGISNLFVMKAACLIARSASRKDISKYGIKVKDHLTTYDGTEAMKTSVAAVKDACEAYEKIKWEWEQGNRAAGRAILGPYTIANYNEFAYRPSLDWGENETNRSL